MTTNVTQDFVTLPGDSLGCWGNSGLCRSCRGEGKLGSPRVCACAPGEPAVPTEAPGTRRSPPPRHSPVVWIHDGNEEDIDSIPLIKSDLVVCWTSQDVIRDIWPLQGNAVVGVMAAHVVLGKGQVCSQAVGLGGPQGWVGTSGLRRRRRRELCALRWLCECRLCLKTTRKTDVTNKIDDRTHATHGGVKKKGAPRPQAGPGPGRGASAAWRWQRRFAPADRGAGAAGNCSPRGLRRLLPLADKRPFPSAEDKPRHVTETLAEQNRWRI